MRFFDSETEVLLARVCDAVDFIWLSILRQLTKDVVSVVPSQVVKHDWDESLILVATCLEVAILMKSHTETTRQVVVVRNLLLWKVEFRRVVLVRHLIHTKWQLAIGTFGRIIICFLVAVPLDTLEWRLLEEWKAFGTQVSHSLDEYLHNISSNVITVGLE